MRRIHRRFAIHSAACLVAQLLFLLPSSAPIWGQSQTSAVPHLVSYSALLKDASHHAVTGLAGVTFLIYADQDGGAPLWLETQNIQPDALGHYTVQLGGASAHGLPAEIFTTGEGRWLALRIGNEPEQPRVLLVAVPYAMKAADAETIGGLPPSAFVLANPRAANAAAGEDVAPPSSGGITGMGTVNTIPLWDSTSDIISSAISQTGTGTTAKIGINNAAPVVPLDVKGATTIRGIFTLPATSVATATAGKPSQQLSFVGSSFNSETTAAVNQTFRLQAEPAANNTAANSGTLNLLYGSGTSTPTETGLKIASNGQITFAPGQTFPGGGGTITGVTSGSGLVGGGTSGNVSLSLLTSCSVNQILKWNGTTWACSADGNSGGTIKGVTAGTDLTGGGTAGVVTVNLDTTKVPQLNAANVFTGDQLVNGNLSSTGLMSASGFNIGGTPFAFGSATHNNSFLGFAGNATTTGSDNVGTGLQALASVSSGFANTATGYQAMILNTTGANNTADGIQALALNTTGFYNAAVGSLALNKNSGGSYNSALGQQTLSANTTGNYNSAIGYNAGPDASHPSLINSTAIGSFSQVTQSNSLVLGSINGVNGSNADTLVGIGTTAPTAKLDVHGTANFTGAVTFAAGQIFPGTGTITGVTAGTGLTGGGSSGGVTLNVDTSKVVTGITAGTDLTGGGTGGVLTLNLDTTKIPVLSGANTFTSNQTFNANLIATNVGIGTSSPAAPLQIDHKPPSGGQDVVMITSGKGTDVASLLIQNTAPGGRLRAGAGTSAAYLASSGPLLFIAGDTGSPSFPSAAAMMIDTTGHVSFGQQITGSLNATGVVQGSLFQISGIPFAFGNVTNFNAFLGFAGNQTTTGNQETASGYQALLSDINGEANVANGYQAMFSNTRGVENAALGSQALYSNTTGSGNSAIGFSALYGNQTGESNIAIGSGALLSSGGSYNIGIGYVAFEGLTSGSYNTCVGYNCEVGVDGLNFATAIGTFATVNQSNSLVLGSKALSGLTSNTAIGIDEPSPTNILTVLKGGGNAIADGWSTYSSRRWKTNIQTLPDALAKVEQLRGVSYDLKDNGKHEIGVIAEEVGAVVPEVVTFEADGKDARGVDYSRLTAVLIEAVKEQQREIQDQLGQIRKQQRQIARLSSKVGVLESGLHQTRAVRQKLQPKPKAAPVAMSGTN